MEKLKLADQPQKEIVPGFLASMIHTANMTFSLVEVEQGAMLPEHHHVHEQVTQLIEGAFELTLEGKTILLQPGDMIVIPSNVKHSGLALEKSKLLDVFHPVREDYR